MQSCIAVTTIKIELKNTDNYLRYGVSDKFEMWWGNEWSRWQRRTLWCVKIATELSVYWRLRMKSKIDYQIVHTCIWCYNYQFRNTNSLEEKAKQLLSDRCLAVIAFLSFIHGWSGNSIFVLFFFCNFRTRWTSGSTRTSWRERTTWCTRRTWSPR